MNRFVPFFLLASLVFGQAPPANLDKPPQDVDDALRARIKQFYDFHVSRKYRQAEQLIAEDAKDDFYVLSKPELRNFKIGAIEYSNNFTKAKVVILGTMPVLLPMSNTREMEMPFASYWEIEKGLWCWYYNKEASRHTPFGDVKESAGASGSSNATSLPAPPRVDLAEIQSAVKIEKSSIDLVAGKPQTIKLVNTLPGPVSLTIATALAPISKSGFEATFDKPALKASETAILTVDVDPRMRVGPYKLRITVSPTNQVLDLNVNVSH